MSKVRNSLFLFTVLLLMAGCGSSDSTSQTGGPSPAANEANTGTQAFSARMGKFSANPNFSDSTSVQKAGANSVLLAYEFSLYIDEGHFNGGNFNIYDCNDAECSVKYLKYVVQCSKNFECLPLDSSKKPIIKGDRDPNGSIYRAGGSSLVTSFNNVIASDDDGKIVKQYILLYFIDPHLLTAGFFDQYLASDYETADGRKTNLKISHLLK